MGKVCLKVLIASLLIGIHANTGWAEELSGSALGADGKYLSAITIIAFGTAEVPWTRAETTTDAQGAFVFPNLKPGTYRLCARDTAGTYLDPCEWGTASTVTLPSGQKSSANTIRLEKGSFLVLHLDDPSRWMAQRAADGSIPDLTLGVWSLGGLYHPMSRVGSSGNGQNYQLAIPPDTPLTFQIVSKHLQLSDADGNTLTEATSKRKVQYKKGGDPPPGLAFRITGRAQ